ncbi:MAG TPA: 3-isopropylmalate dehydratase, partial [Polyangiaceae bacterium]|nr:3-isopropylmalate dehydratase [Polyangiaceae bacterium]
FVVGSAETLAYAVATGTLGDPRSFKRPVRVTVPRTLPTDDVLIVRKAKAKTKEGEAVKGTPAEQVATAGWKAAQVLPVVANRKVPNEPSAMVLETLDDVRWVVRRAPDIHPLVRAVVAPFIPSGCVPVLAGVGILALSAAPETIEQLKAAGSLSVAEPAEWNGNGSPIKDANQAPITLKWLAVGAERQWTELGTAWVPAPAKR